MWISILLVLGGVVGLYFGSRWLVGGSSRIARKFGVSPLVIGLTLVAFGTSAPELFVCLIATFKGASSLTMGNVVGSNIANIGLILGFAGLIRSFGVERRLINIDIPIIIVSGIILWIISYTGEVNRWFGIILLVIFSGFLLLCFKDPPDSVEAEVPDNASKNIVLDSFLVLLGLVVLAGGGQGLVEGAKDIALYFNVPENIVGLTLVAVGTSLPELAASLYAIITGQTDISIGNIVGSNIFNTTFVMGTVATIQPVTVERSFFMYDIPIMLFFSILIFPLLRHQWQLNRPKSAFLFVLYFGYIIFLSQIKYT